MQQTYNLISDEYVDVYVMTLWSCNARRRLIPLSLLMSQ